MNRTYKPTSLPLHSIFATCALAITFAVAAFIDMLASDRGAIDAYVAVPTVAMTTHG